MDLRLKNSVFLVTGGSKGIGREIVLELLTEGAAVTACARNDKNLRELYDGIPGKSRENLLTVTADILNSGQMEQVVMKTVARFGKLDGVVASAGSGSLGTVLETKNEEWRNQFEIKVCGILNTVRPAIDELLKSDHPRIVIMNGITANIPDMEMAAVKQIAYMLANSLAPKICVNTVNLGAVDTERQSDKYQKAGSSLSFEAWKGQEAKRRGIPFGRFGQAKEVVPMVLLLLSPLSSYITGSSINIDGGLNVCRK